MQDIFYIFTVIILTLLSAALLFALGLIYSFKHVYIYKWECFLGKEFTFKPRFKCPHANCSMPITPTVYQSEPNVVKYWHIGFTVSEYKKVCCGCGQEVFFSTEFELDRSLGEIARSFEELRAHYPERTEL
ncbi:hypothetical protein VCHA53O466_140136 [Vibrio chagasii]|nr:hypothetical protein VCHA53O466_140136 [Vibrio chagasii]